MTADNVPATIRYNNPGAMYPGPSSKKFGGRKVGIIGGGHKIVEFPDPVSGAAAMFDLLNRAYSGLPLAKAIEKWSGGNSVPTYVTRVSKAVGLKPAAILSLDVLKDRTRAISLAKEMAAHETGAPFPLSHAQWLDAFERANSTTPTLSTTEDESAPWLKRCIAQVGQKEVAGKGSNPAILRKLALIGFTGPNVDDSNVPWCGAQVAECVADEGYPLPKNPGMARSWLRYGKTVSAANVRPGDIFVVARPDGGPHAGHVGFVASVDHRAGTFVGIAGNSANQVRYEAPRSLKSALGFSRPVLGDRPVVDTIRQSYSIKTSLNVFALIASFLTGVFQWAVELVGRAPEIVTQTQTNVDAVNQVSGWFSVSTPVQVLLVVVALSALTIAIREINFKRAQ